MTSALRRLGLAAALLAASVVAARAEVSEVRIAYQYGFIYLPVEVAIYAGLIEKRAEAAGLGKVKVEGRQISGTPAMNEALVSGNVDFGALGLPGVLIGWDKTKGHLKCLAAMPLTAFTLFANKPEIKTVKDFTDEDKIAFPAPTSGQGIFLRMAMEQAWGKGEYMRADRLMAALPHPDAVAALLAGHTISGYFATPPFAQMVEKNGAGKVHKVIGSKEILGGTEANGGGLLGRAAFVDKNPKFAKAVYDAIVDANEFIKAKPREAAEIFIKAENSKMSVEDAAAVVTDGSHVWQVEPSQVVAIAEFMARTGQMRTVPKDWKEVFFPFIHDRQGS